MEQLRLYAAGIAKWLAVSLPVGAACGLLGSAFHIGVEYASELRETYGWIIFLLPFAGLAAVAVYRLFRVEGKDTNNILGEIQSGRGIPFAMLPAVFLTTLLTHLAGGSAGREGAALQMGGTIGFGIGRLLRLDDRDLRTATMTGMAAFFSALFGTPLGATVFAMGVVSVGLLYHAAFLPCLIASLTAYGISLLLGIAPTRFPVAVPALTIPGFLRTAVLAALCALVSVLFCAVLHVTEQHLKKVLKNPWLRAFAGGTLLLALTLLVGTRDYNGTGMDVIAAAIEQGQTHGAAFAWKILFTALTLSVGFKGGEVVPSFFVGATFGCLVGPLLGLPAGFAAAVGLICVFCGAVNCPMASMVLAVEMFGSQGMLFYALACALSYVLSGYSGIYSGQRIVYDKLKAQFIDVHANDHREGVETDAGRRYS